MPIRLVILDDHPLFREGIRSVISKHPDFEIVGEGGSGEELVQLVRSHQPDLITLDLGMPQHMGGHRLKNDSSFKALPALRWLQKEYPATRVVVLSQYLHPPIVEATAEAGAGGYLLKDDELSRNLPAALRAVYGGGVYFSSTIMQEFGELQQPRTANLTERQIEILQAVVNHPEWNFVSHSDSLGISEFTYRNHMRQIYDRLGVKSLTAAILRAIEAGLVITKK